MDNLIKRIEAHLRDLTYVEELLEELIFLDDFLNRFPSPYSPSYLFDEFLPMINRLMDNESENFEILHKGVLFAKSLIGRICPNDKDTQLRAHLLETDCHKDFIEKIIQIIIYCEPKQIRQNGIQTLNLYLWAFEDEGKYNFLTMMINTSKFPGLVGYMIMQIKEFVRKQLKLENNNENNTSSSSSDYFIGPKFQKLLGMSCKLKNGVETDLMEFNDQILSSLNILRYLINCDGQRNRTGFLESMENIQNTFLKPLRTGLDLSTAHYKLKIRELKDPNSSNYKKTVADSQINSTLEVGGETLDMADITPESQADSLEKCLLTFDLIECNLADVHQDLRKLKKNL